MDGFEHVYVSHNQMLVLADYDFGELPIYTVGNDLVHLSGETALTVMTGLHTGKVAVRVRVLSRAPEDAAAGWDAVTEATLWCPDGRLSVCGLMGDCPDPLRDIEVDGPGLMRVQVRARNQQPDDFSDAEPEPEPREEYEVLAWSVREETGMKTVRTDDMPTGSWTPDREKAAGWAMVQLVTKANPDPLRARVENPAAERGRVDIQRRCPVPGAPSLGWIADLLGATVEGDTVALPVGDLKVELRLPDPMPEPDGDIVAEWRWLPSRGSSTQVPDSRISTVELRPSSGSVVHRGVRDEDAVLLGLVWDYLLDDAQRSARPHPWQPLFDDIAATAAQRATDERLRQERQDARGWGGWPPSDRLRTLPANVQSIARLDRRLLDALADTTPESQRDIARWAARRACTVAGLAPIDWIAHGLAALEHDRPLPPPFDDDAQAWHRLFADPRVPNTTVTIPSGISNFSQQAAAFPAIVAAFHDDPLVAAVDALHSAAAAHGSAHPELFSEARAAFPALQQRDG